MLLALVSSGSSFRLRRSCSTNSGSNFRPASSNHSLFLLLIFSTSSYFLSLILPSKQQRWLGTILLIHSGSTALQQKAIFSKGISAVSTPIQGWKLLLIRTA